MKLEYHIRMTIHHGGAIRSIFWINCENKWMWPAVQDDQNIYCLEYPPPPLPQIRSSSDSRATCQHSMNLLFSCLTIQTTIHLFIITKTRAPFYPWCWEHDLNLGSRLRRRRILYSLLIEMTLAGDAN